MSNAARKARKKAGIRFERTPKTPTGYLGRASYDIPTIDADVMAIARELGRTIWERNTFR